MTFSKVNPLLVRHRKLSRIEEDQEIFHFINGLDRYHTINELHQLLIKRFGAERTPSKSSLGRFLQKISKQYKKKLREGC